MILASICMRGGSKGVIGKNSRMLSGRPLMEYTFDCAKSSKFIDDIVVSSDSEDILKISRNNNINFIFKREDRLSTDDASKWDVFKDLVLKFEEKTSKRIDFLVDLDVTVPRRRPEHIDSSIDMILNNDVDVVITGYDPERNPYFNMMEVDNNNLAQLVKTSKKPIVCRQNAPKVYSLSPAVYVIRRDALFLYDHWANAKCMINPIPRENAIDIDTEFDFQLVEFLMARE
jgi:CMP-N,N'-diacetyllegionaminic acid synthase